MENDKVVKHVALQESNDLKRWVHSAPCTSIAAILQLENNLFDFS